jgi:hypothetical protein
LLKRATKKKKETQGGDKKKFRKIPVNLPALRNVYSKFILIDDVLFFFLNRRRQRRLTLSPDVCGENGKEEFKKKVYK